MNESIAKGTAVLCDEDGCGWNRHVGFDAVKDWFQKPCPRCGQGEIVNTDDLLALALIAGLEVLDVAKILEQGDTKTEKTVKLNSRELMKGPTNVNAE